MRDEARIGVMAFRLGLDQQAREDDAPLLQRRDELELGVGQYHHGQVRRLAVARQDARDFGFVEFDERSEAAQLGAQRIFVARQQGDRITRNEDSLRGELRRDRKRTSLKYSNSNIASSSFCLKRK